MPYNGEFHFTALRTLGTFRTISASRRFPRSRFQPGIAAMYARTGASPSAFAICGLPPERRTTFPPLRTLIGLAFAPAFGGGLDLVADLRGLLARDVPLAFGFALLIRLPFLRRRAILGNRGLHERLERARIDRLPFADVDRPSGVALQAGIEEARWVGEPDPLGERELHDLRV